jgi:hypothetical protein
VSLAKQWLSLSWFLGLRDYSYTRNMGLAISVTDAILFVNFLYFQIAIVRGSNKYSMLSRQWKLQLIETVLFVDAVTKEPR